MIKILLFLICLASCLPAQASDIPRPQGWVNDFADCISRDYRDKINTLISELKEKTSAEIAVVTVSSIAPYDETEYARMLFDSWRPGEKGKDNGVLILLALKERRWRIETGYGLEGVLPDGLCGQIGRRYMVPRFKEGNFSQGLYHAAVEISRIIASDAGVSLNEPDIEVAGRVSAATPLFMYIFLPLFFFIWNLPWPFFIGLPVTLLFAVSFFAASRLLGYLVLLGYAASLLVRYLIWSHAPAGRRGSYWGAQSYGTGRHSGSGGCGGFGGSSGGFGGFGGGSGAGGGAGGGF